MKKQIILPKKFSSTFISKTFFPLDYKEKTLSSINSGRCYDWAYLAYCLWPDTLLWTTDMHAWIQFGNKFYDSESVRGLKDHNCLNCNAMFPAEAQAPTIMTSESFQKFWNKYGGGRRRHWHELYQDILDVGLIPIRK